MSNYNINDAGCYERDMEVTPELRLLEVDIHDWSVGLMFSSIDRYSEETPREKNKIHKHITYLVMKSLGFSNKKEYLKAYPGNYAFDSAIVPAMKLERFVTEPRWRWDKNKYGVMESLRVYSSCIFNGTIEDVIERVCVNVGISMKSNDNFGSITLFPTVKDFMKYAKVDNPEKYKKKLWFCLDWEEE